MDKQIIKEILEKFIEEENLDKTKEISIFLNHVQELSKRCLNNCMFDEELDCSLKQQIQEEVFELAKKLSHIICKELKLKKIYDFEIFLLATHILMLYKRK